MSAFTSDLNASATTQSNFDLRATIPESASLITLPKLDPTIVAAPGRKFDEVATAAVLDHAGIYVGIWYGSDKPTAYAGQSRWSVTNRLGDAKFRCPKPADLLIGITDVAGRLTRADVRVLERLMHITMMEAGYAVHGRTPSGAVVSSERYALLRTFFGKVCVSLKLSRLLFLDLPDARLLAGPITEAGIVRSDVPNGDHFVLDTPLGVAEMIESAKSFVVLPGSPARFDATPACKAVGVVAQELVHAGILIPVMHDWYSIAKPIRFGSASAAARLVTGAVAGSPDRWRSIKRGCPGKPTRVAIGRVPANVATRVASPIVSTAASHREEAFHV